MRFNCRLQLISICMCALGCGTAETGDEPVRRMVYVDTETMTPLVQAVSESLPAVNPKTGKRTLMAGLYCAECQTWYPVPPPDQINRRPNAALCPKTRTPLTLDGPWPDGVEASLLDRS